MATLHSSREVAEDRLPLLTNQEDALEDDAIEIEFHGSGKKRGARSTTDVLGSNSSSSSSGLLGDGGERSSRHGVSLSSASGSGAPSRRKKHYSGSEMIVAVFVVTFDIKKGWYVCFGRSDACLEKMFIQAFMHYCLLQSDTYRLRTYNISNYISMHVQTSCGLQIFLKKNFFFCGRGGVGGWEYN